MVEGSWIRNPVVAGMFYPDNRSQLRKSVEDHLVREKEFRKPLFMLVPHAGYIYSGSTAGKTFAACDLPSRIVVLGPNHTGLGADISVWPRGSWATPLGKVRVDGELGEMLLSSGSGAEEDSLAHRREHSIEVQLPFLQVRYEDPGILPVCVGAHGYDELARLGAAMAAAFRKIKDDVAFVVSSDMNHYESAEVNRKKDETALEAMTAMDPQGLYDAVVKNRITMCGFAPAVAALIAAKELGALQCELVDYSHSGMVTGDDGEVVSYAGLRAW